MFANDYDTVIDNINIPANTSVVGESTDTWWNGTIMQSGVALIRAWQLSNATSSGVNISQVKCLGVWTSAAQPRIKIFNNATTAAKIKAELWGSVIYIPR